MGPMMGLVGWTGLVCQDKLHPGITQGSLSSRRIHEENAVSRVSIKAGYWWYTATYKASYCKPLIFVRCLENSYLLPLKNSDPWVC